MCGSKPLPDAVAKSTGTGDEFSGSAALSSAMRAFTTSRSAGLVGPRFEAVEPLALFGMGEVAEILPQKYLGSENGWLISDEPISLPSAAIRLPEASRANNRCPTKVTASGYTTPVSTVSTQKITNKGRNVRFMVYSLHPSQGRKRQIDELDADKRHGDAAQAIDEQIPAQQRCGSERAILDAFQRQRNQQHNDERVENDGGQDGRI